MQTPATPVLDDAFALLQQAEREAATSAHNYKREPTEAMAKAGNYAKARLTLHGLPLVIENVRNSVRTGTSENGKTWANRMAASYGEIAGTKGTDGDPVDVFIGHFPEARGVWVINQGWPDGGFDEHKVMLGFATEQQARDAYLLSFDRDWTGLQSMVASTLEQLKWWLKHGDMRRPFSQDQLPFDGSPAMNKTFWSADAEPVSMTMQKLMYDLRSDDKAGLLLDSVSLADLVGDPDCELLPHPILDALVVPVARMSQRMDQMMRVMHVAGGGKIVPTDYTISEPIKARGVLQVAVLFALSDGQAVTIWFHNPDTTPAKLTPLDELVSWKWMLNKKDITIVVAPERGRELNPREVARRIMRLAEKNSAKFQEANKALAEKTAAIAALDTEIAGLETRLSEVQGQIADVKQRKEVEAEDAAKGQSAAEREAFLTTAAGYATIANDEAQLLANQDMLDAFFRERIIAVRNALRELGWDGAAYQPLTKGGAKLQLDTVRVGAGSNVVGVTYRVKNDMGGEVGNVRDGLEGTPADVAFMVDALLLTMPQPEPESEPDPEAEPEPQPEPEPQFEDDSAELVAAALAASRAGPSGISRLKTSDFFTFDFDGEEPVLSDELRAKVEADLGEPLVEYVFPGYEGQVNLVPASAVPAQTEAKPKRVTKKEASEAYDSLSYAINDLQGHTSLEFAKADLPTRLAGPVAGVQALVDRGWPASFVSPANLLERAQELIDRWSAARADGSGGLPDSMGRGDANTYLRDKGLSEDQAVPILATPTGASMSGEIEVPSYARDYLDASAAAALAAAATVAEPAEPVEPEPPADLALPIEPQQDDGVAQPADTIGEPVIAQENATPVGIDWTKAEEVNNSLTDLAHFGEVAINDVGSENVYFVKDGKPYFTKLLNSADFSSGQAVDLGQFRPGSEASPAGESAVDPQQAADRAYLESLADGSGDLMAENTFSRLEPMFAKYEGDADMTALLERAAQAYGDAAIAAAQGALKAA